MTQPDTSMSKPAPQVKTTTEYDFMECRDYIESKIPGGGETLWQYACNYWDLHNDSYLSWFADPDIGEDEEEKKAMKLFYDEFVKPHENDHLLFYVSW